MKLLLRYFVITLSFHLFVGISFEPLSRIHGSVKGMYAWIGELSENCLTEPKRYSNLRFIQAKFRDFVMIPFPRWPFMPFQRDVCL